MRSGWPKEVHFTPPVATIIKIGMRRLDWLIWQNFHGSLWLIDRQNLKSLNITLCESEAAMLKSDERDVAKQAGTSAAGGARSATERNEIVDRFRAA